MEARASRSGGGVERIQWSVNETWGMSEVPAFRMWQLTQSPVDASATVAALGRVQTWTWASAPWQDRQASAKWSGLNSEFGRCGSWHVVHVISRPVPTLSWKQALRIMRSAWLAIPNDSGSSSDASVTNTDRCAESGRPGRYVVGSSPGAKTVWPVRWHCWHTSSCRSVESAAGFTIWASSGSPPASNAATWAEPGPWHRSHEMPRGMSV